MEKPPPAALSLVPTHASGGHLRSVGVPKRNDQRRAVEPTPSQLRPVDQRICFASPIVDTVSLRRSKTGAAPGVRHISRPSKASCDDLADSPQNCSFPSATLQCRQERSPSSDHRSLGSMSSCFFRSRPPHADAHSMAFSGPIGAHPRERSGWAMWPLPKIDIAPLSWRLEHLRSALDRSAPAHL